MKQKVFRLTETQINTLKSIATERGCTETDVIRSCIDQLSIKQPEKAEYSNEAIAALTGQLAEKDRTIDRLLDALAESQRVLGEAQEATKAAQALHAAEKQETMALESPEQKMSRWKRLKRAWKG